MTPSRASLPAPRTSSPAASASSHGVARAPSAWPLWALLAVGLLVPLLAHDRLSVGTHALLLVTLAVGLGIVVVFAGLLDLGYAAFFALGGYTLALLTTRVEGFEPWLALLLAGVVAALFGLLFGLPSVRTRSEYLAIVTIAFGEIVPSVIWHLDWTGGGRGVRGARLPELGSWSAGPMAAYALALMLAVGAVIAALRLQSSRTGRSWAAVRDDETAAAALGVPPARTKLLAFVCGAAIAGWAGALFAGQTGYVEPAQFDLTLSLMILAAVVAGSRWGITGIVFGALAIAAYDRVLVDLVGKPIGVDLRAHNLAVFGLALYATALTRARGTLPISTSRSATP